MHRPIVVDDGVGSWTIRNDRSEHPIHSIAELEGTLDVLQEEAHSRPRLVTIVVPSGAELLIGVGGVQSVLQFSEGLDPPYLVTLGRPDASGVELFYCGGEETEIPRRNLIPTEGARHAAAAFFETGSKPQNVAWEEI